MGDELKTGVEKLVSNGSNWVTYRDHMIWSLRSCRLPVPQMRWESEEATTMQIITVSIPNSGFTNIRSHTTAKDMWDALKVLYEGRMTMVLVKLGQQLQSMCCGDEETVREHFNKLANLRGTLLPIAASCSRRAASCDGQKRS
jgi:LTR polyprotein gag-polypeptide-like protein